MVWKKTAANKWENNSINEYSVIDMHTLVHNPSDIEYILTITHEEFANTKENFQKTRKFKDKKSALKVIKFYKRKLK